MNPWRLRPITDKQKNILTKCRTIAHIRCQSLKGKQEEKLLITSTNMESLHTKTNGQLNMDIIDRRSVKLALGYQIGRGR